MTCYLYRHFDAAGTLLYVGISLCAFTRLSQHKGSPWVNEIARVEIERHPTREYALFQETRAIETERPKYNKIRPSFDPHSPTLTMICVEQARNEIWVKSWDPEADTNGHDDALDLCTHMEAVSIIDLYRRRAEGKRDA